MKTNYNTGLFELSNLPASYERDSLFAGLHDIKRIDALKKNTKAQAFSWLPSHTQKN
jgi:hypothetical protein